jgi:hypothetical protein
MSHVEPERIACPSCGATHEHMVFRSLNGEHVPAQVQHLLDGTFEQIACACGHAYRPEHQMVYAHYALRTWVVMYPRADRDRFATLERGVELVFERDFRAAPRTVAAGLRGVRPRLVFGQLALSEAVRVSEAGLEPAILECAKLLVFRRNLAAALAHGPAELIFEGLADGERLQLGVVELATGARRGAVTAAPYVLDEVEAARDEFAARYPALFTRPYASATRYLFGGEAGGGAGEAGGGR